MKNITIITEQVSDAALAAALPARGVASVAVGSAVRPALAPAETYRGFRNPNRFTPNYRIDLVVDDDAVESVFDGISFAYGAGLFSAAEVWVNAPALALTA